MANFSVTQAWFQHLIPTRTDIDIAIEQAVGSALPVRGKRGIAGASILETLSNAQLEKEAYEQKKWANVTKALENTLKSIDYNQL